MRRPVKISLAVSAAGLLLLAGLLTYELGGLGELRGTSPKRNAAVDIGGPFSLLDTKGAQISDAQFAGRPLLIFFGFTYCPDVCPTSLDLLGATLTRLEAQAPDTYAALQPLFISVDPARDTPAQMADYLSYFHPKIIGLTGSEAQITVVKKAYRVYAVKRPETDANGNYNVDHSSFFFLMDGDNRYLAHFDHGLTDAQFANRLAAKLAAAGY